MTAACSVSGTTVTCGTPVFVSNNTNAPTNGFIDLSSSTYALTYKDSANSSKLTTAACSVSGTTVTCGTPVVVSNSTNFPATGVIDLSSSTYEMTYQDSTNSSVITTAACSVSGTTVTCGTPVVVSNNSTNPPNSSIALGSSAYAMTYPDSTNGNKLMTVACSVSGTTVTCGTPVVVSNSTNAPTNGFVDLNSSLYEMTYKDSTNSNKMVTLAGEFISASANYLVGVAATPGNTGQSVNVVSQGIASGFSGLTIGTVYYANTDGTIDTTQTPNRLGVAVSSTQILLSPGGSGNSTTLNFGDAIFANNFRITEGQNALQSLIFLNENGQQIAQLDEAGTLSINNLSLAGPQSATGTTLCLDVNNNVVTSENGCGSFATTTINELLSTSTTLSVATSTQPWAGALATASNSLQTALANLTSQVIRVFNEPIYAATGIFNDLFALTVHTETVDTDHLCISESNGSNVCISGDQLAILLGTRTAFQSATDTPPQIQINGDNPAIVQVSAIYNDLGAKITGPTADLNLGIITYLNGTLTSDIVIDTGQIATDTIDYVVTDQNGLTSTSTRTVLVEAPSVAPSDNAATSTPPLPAATSTATTTAS